MGRRRYGSSKNSSASWANFEHVHWPFVVRSAYRDYVSVLQPVGELHQGLLEPSHLKMILCPLAQPVLQSLRARSAPFSEVRPELSAEFPPEPVHPGDPPPSAAEPEWQDYAPAQPKLGFIDAILDAISGKSASIERAARERFKMATNEWRRERYSLQRNEENYKTSLKRYRQDLPAHRENRSKLESELGAELQRYEDRRRQYDDARKSDLAELDEMVARVATGEAPHIEALARQILRSMIMPIQIPEGVEVVVDPGEGIMLITVPVPNLEEAGLVVQLKTKTRPATDREIRSSQELLVHALSLRIIHEIFATPEMKNLALVGVNMRLAYTNRQNGQAMNDIIGSLAATREEFSGINIAEVDPKLCFRSLKGVATPSFQDLSPVRPLLTFDRFDKRIVESRAIVDELSNETNLAAMDWEDFEHVVRELFSKMFSARSEAAEVHVTRASRDYGVDAIIHDPDPIHGGKFVIQAKRYVNTVDVAAVRDLFGTVQNEGANRGYLVTTSSFGPDAYGFAKGKPLTLIDGMHLLQLLKDHGYSFRIDIQEARQILHGR